MSNAMRDDGSAKSSSRAKGRAAGWRKTVPSTPEELEAICPLRPIQNEAEYDRVRALAEKLVVLTDPTPLQEEWCDRLCDFMEAYEDLHHPM